MGNVFDINNTESTYNTLIEQIAQTVAQSKQKAIRAVNNSLVEMNWNIGILCRSKNNTKVEYALRGMTQPLGVAAYKTKELIENLKSSLPSIDDLEKTLND